MTSRRGPLHGRPPLLPWLALLPLLGGCSPAGTGSVVVNQDFPLVAVSLFDSGDEVIEQVVPALGSFWVETRSALWVTGSEGPRKVIDEPIHDLVPGDGVLWAAARDGLYRITTPSRQPERVLGGAGLVFGDPSSGLLVSGQDGIWHVGAGPPRKISSARLREAVTAGRFLLAATSEGILRLEPASGAIREVWDAPAFDLVALGSSVLVATREGVVRLGEDGEIDGQLHREVQPLDMLSARFEALGDTLVFRARGGLLWVRPALPPRWIETAGGVRDVRASDGRLVVCTDREALVVSEQGEVVGRLAVGAEPGWCWLREIAGATWVSLEDLGGQGGGSTWRVGPEGDLRRVGEGGLSHWASGGGVVWISTSSGVFRVHGSESRQLLDRRVTGLYRGGAGVWASEDGSLTLLRDDGEREEYPVRHVVEVEEIGGVIWAVAGAEADVLRLGPDGFERFAPRCRCSVHEGFPGETVLMSDDAGAILVRPGGDTVRVGHGRIDGARFAGGFLWLHGEWGVWRVGQDGSWVHVGEGRLRELFERDGVVWVSTIAGTWRVRPDGGPEELSEVPAGALDEHHGFLWLSTDSGLLISGGAGGEVRRFGRGQVLGVTELGSSVEAVTTRELVRFVPAEVSVTTRPRTGWTGILEPWLPGIWASGNRRLVVEARGPQGERFELPLDSFSPASSWSLLPDGESAAASGVLPFEPWGRREVVFDLRDELGNRFVAGPGLLTALVLDLRVARLVSAPVALWVVVGTLLFVASPRSPLAHGLLVGVWGRTLRYRPVLQAGIRLSARVRRRFLKPYRTAVTCHLEKSPGRSFFVERRGDLESRSFARQLSAPGLVILLGESGVGKTTLAEALCRYLLDVAPKGGPMPLLLSIHDVKTTVAAAATEFLSSFGGFPGADPQDSFASDLLETGRFLLVVDNFDAVPSEQRGSVLAELEVLAARHVVLLVAQERPPELEILRFHYRVLPLRRLEDEEVEAVLRLRFGAERGAELLQAVSAEARRDLRNAETLTLACELYEREGRWNLRNEIDLYATLVGDLLRLWAETGPEDDRHNLLALAEDSWRHRRPLFDAGVLSTESLQQLEERRILLRRGRSQHRFRHDRLRAYLVSLVLEETWRERSMEDMDERWIVPLNMLVQRMSDPRRLRDLCTKVLRSNLEYGKRVFAHARKHVPWLVQGWEEAFVRDVVAREIDALGD